MYKKGMRFSFPRKISLWASFRNTLVQSDAQLLGFQVWQTQAVWGFGWMFRGDYHLYTIEGNYISQKELKQQPSA